MVRIRGKKYVKCLFGILSLGLHGWEFTFPEVPVYDMFWEVMTGDGWKGRSTEW